VLIGIYAVFLAAYVAGGQLKGWIRDVGCPILLGLAVALQSHNWWLPLLIVGTANAIRLGYGAYDPEHDDKPSWLALLTKDRQGSFIRCLWGQIVALAIGIPLMIAGALNPALMFLYIGIAGAVGYGVSKLRLWVYPTDVLVASSLYWIVFFVKPA